jgi:protein-tyrosine-phosphatase
MRPDDLVVSVCDNAHEHLAGQTATAPRLHWAIPDPARGDTDDAFETAYTQLAERLDRLATAVTPQN